MKKMVIVFVTLWAMQLPVYGQVAIKGNFDNFFIDALGNFYSVAKNTIIKYDKEGQETARYTDFINGNISWIDVSNPLKIMVYFRQFDQVIFLDKYLSESSDLIELTEHGVISSELAATSYDNGIWVYDHSAVQLIRLDENLNISHQSGPAMFNPADKYRFLHQSGQWVLLALGRQVMIFDRFAAYHRQISLPDSCVVTWARDALIWVNNRTITRYNFSTHQSKTNVWTHDRPLAVRYQNQRIYYLTEDGIFLASF